MSPFTSTTDIVSPFTSTTDIVSPFTSTTPPSKHSNILSFVDFMAVRGKREVKKPYHIQNVTLSRYFYFVFIRQLVGLRAERTTNRLSTPGRGKSVISPATFPHQLRALPSLVFNASVGLPEYL